VLLVVGGGIGAAGPATRTFESVERKVLLVVGGGIGAAGPANATVEHATRTKVAIELLMMLGTIFTNILLLMNCYGKE